MKTRIEETCPRCGGWVWHRDTPCNCKAPAATVPEPQFLELLGKRIRTLREARGWSMDKLAAKIPMSKTGLWQIEKGRSEPMAKTIVALASVLGVTTDHLLLRE